MKVLCVALNSVVTSLPPLGREGIKVMREIMETKFVNSIQQAWGTPECTLGKQIDALCSDLGGAFASSVYPPSGTNIVTIELIAYHKTFING